MIEEKNKSRNAVYVRRHPRGKAKTSARAIKLKQRMAEVLSYRVTGYSYEAIAKNMGVSTSTACDYAMKAVAAIVPRETAQQILAQELLKLDAMQSGVFQAAADGDIPAIGAMLDIMKMRARLTGLIDTKHPGAAVNLNIGGGEPSGAAVHGITVRLIGAPDHPEDDPAPKLIDTPRQLDYRKP